MKLRPGGWLRVGAIVDRDGSERCSGAGTNLGPSREMEVQEEQEQGVARNLC